MNRHTDPLQLRVDRSKLSDEALMVRLKGGDRLACTALYSRWRHRIFHFLVRRTGSVTLAEEALQDTWLRVYRSCHRYDPDRPFARWLFTLAARAGSDAREPQLEELDFEESYDDRPLLRTLVVQALHALDPVERRLVLLQVEGFSSREIGEMLELRPGAVRMRLNRARARLRASLGELP